MKRCVVIPPAIMNVSQNNVHLKRSYNSEDLIYFCLYWDKVATTVSRVIHIGLPFEKELMEAGVLERKSFEHPKIFMPGGVGGGEDQLWSFEKIVKEKLDDDKNDWIIHHLSDEPVYSDNNSLRQNLTRLKITNLLPIPKLSEKNSIIDILEFKERRADELKALHSTLDNVLKKIHSEEIEVLKKVELEHLRIAIQELDKTVVERFKVYKKSDLEVSLDLGPSNILDLGKALINPLNFMDVGTALLSLISISQKYGVTFNYPALKNKLNLDYLASAKSEYII